MTELLNPSLSELLNPSLSELLNPSLSELLNPSLSEEKTKKKSSFRNYVSRLVWFGRREAITSGVVYRTTFFSPSISASFFEVLTHLEILEGGASQKEH